MRFDFYDANCVAASTARTKLLSPMYGMVQLARLTYQHETSVLKLTHQTVFRKRYLTRSVNVPRTCYDTIGWLTGSTSAMWKPPPAISPNSIMPTSQKLSQGSFGEIGDLSRGSRRYMGKSRECLWASAIATCQGGLQNSRDKSATSPFASGKLAKSANRHGEVSDVTDKSTGTSRDCHGRHEELSIVEFGFTQPDWAWGALENS